MEPLPAHSALGGSGAYQWMKCPGSIHLSKGVQDTESDYAIGGTVAHNLLEKCLNTKTDAWEFIGASDHQYDFKIDKETADAVQVAIDHISQTFPDADQGNSWVEKFFHNKDFHPLMFGRVDFAFWSSREKHLHVMDYKHGAGIEVNVPWNPQLMYYAVGLIADLDISPDRITIWVVQPRAFHYEGPIRQWTISNADLMTWAESKLLPAMVLAGEVSLMAEKGKISDAEFLEKYLHSGSHCRFCPARLPWSKFCPRLAKEMEELGGLMAKVDTATKLSNADNETLGALLSKFELAKIVQKAVREVAFVRAEKGQNIPGWKLAAARANREWKEEAEKILKKEYGERAYSKPELLSPAKIDALPKGKDFTKRYAFKPEAGLQLVPEDDNRPTIGPQTKSMFKPIDKNKLKKLD